MQKYSRNALDYLVKKGVLERLHPGAYRFFGYEPEAEFQWENLALAAATIPKWDDLLHFSTPLLRRNRLSDAKNLDSCTTRITSV